MKIMRCPTLKDLPAPPKGKTGWPWTEETPRVPDKMPNGSSWPRISIVTPSYNQASFVEETIRAVLLQGYPDLEYIISEDSSTDESIEVIKKYEPWLQILAGERNMGMSHAINKGFERCTGDIITWIASDDLYLPGAFCNVGLKGSQLKECGVAVGGFRFMDENSKIDTIDHPPRLAGKGPLDLSLEEPESWRLHQAATFYTRDALDDVGRSVREDLCHNMDRELLYRILLKHKALLIDDTLALFRQHGMSKSWSVSNMIPMAHEYAAIQRLFFTDSKADNRRRSAIARYRIANGYVKFAKYNQNIVASAAALFKALFYEPSFLLKRDYIVAWIKLFKERR